MSDRVEGTLAQAAVRIDAQEAADLRDRTRLGIKAFLMASQTRSLGYRDTLVIPPFKIYMRTAARSLDGSYSATLDIATIENIEDTGRGALVIFLKVVEQVALEAKRAVYVECVNNPNLGKHLVRHGYKLRDEEFSTSYFKTVTTLEAEAEAESESFSKKY